MPAKTLDKEVSDTVVLLYNNKYYDFNFRHFHEYLLEEENIRVSYNFVYKTLMKNGITPPRIITVTKKRLAKEKLTKGRVLHNKTEKEIEIIINNEITLEASQHRGKKPKYFGKVTEMDGRCIYGFEMKNLVYI